jgi:hypothetical protein
MNRMVCSWIVTAGLIAQMACGQNAPQKPETTTPAAPAEAGTPAAAPKVHFDRLVYDFGKTSMVHQLAGKFIISNTGSATLENIKAQPTCGCTVAKPNIDKLAPGEKTELPFTLNVGTARGNVEKKITVTSNDPTQPSVILTLKAELVPTFDISPALISLGNIHQGSTTNITVQIKRLDGKPLGLTRADATQPNVRPKLEPVAGSTDTALLRVEIEAEGAPRPINDAVRVFAEDGVTAAINVPIGGRVVGDVMALPEQQFWGIIDPDNWPGSHPEQQSKRFTVQCTKPGAVLEIKKASSDLPDISVEYKPLEAGKSYEVIATLAKAPKQTERGNIRLETNLDSQPYVDLGLTVNVIRRN